MLPHRPFSRLQLTRYAPVFGLASTILLLSWFGRPIQMWLRQALGLEGLLLAVLGASIIFAAGALQYFRIRSPAAAAALLVFPIGVWILRANPEEGVHLVEFGLFALTVQWCLPKASGEPRRVLYTILAGAALGVADESLQGLNPQRIFDLRDIAFNIVGVASATIGLKPKAWNEHV